MRARNAAVVLKSDAGRTAPELTEKRLKYTTTSGNTLL